MSNLQESEEALLTKEAQQVIKMLLKEALLYGLSKDDAIRKVDNVIMNLPMLQGVVRQVGFRYGMAPHRMGQQMREEFRKIGASFLEGSSCEDGFNLAGPLEVGMDVAKSIVVPWGSSNFEEWKGFLDET